MHLAHRHFTRRQCLMCLWFTLGAQSATPQAVEQVKYGAWTIAVEPQQFEFVSCAQVKIPPLRSIHT